MNNGKTIREALRKAKKQVEKPNAYKHDVLYTNLGQWKYPGQVTRIPSNDITMQGVPYPVYGEDDLGYGQMMYPGMDYTFPGQYVTEIPMAQKGYNIVPNVEYVKGMGSQYDPIMETIYIDSEDPEDPEKLLQHEMWHHYQNYNNYLRLPEDFPTRKRPQTPSTDKVFQEYYNRKKDDVEQLSRGFRERYPEFKFVPNQVLYDRAIDGIQYDQPWAMEGEGRAAESPEGIEFLRDQGYDIDQYREMLEKAKNKKAYGGIHTAQVGVQTPPKKTNQDDVLKRYNDLLKGDEELFSQIEKDKNTSVFSKIGNAITDIVKNKVRSDYEDIKSAGEYIKGLVGGVERKWESMQEEDPRSIAPVIKQDTHKVTTPKTLPSKKTAKTETKQPDISFGYKELYTVPDVNRAKDSLVAFTNTFDNDQGARYMIGHKAKEVTDAGAQKTFNNARAVAHFLRDSDILPNQKITPKEWGTSKGFKFKTTSPGKTVSAVGFNDPEKFRTLYKPNPANDGTYLIKYLKNKELTPEKSKDYSKEGWELDFTVSNQHKFSDIAWDKEGTSTGYAAKSKWVPLKNGKHTYIPYKNKDGFSRFSGGSVIYLFKDPKSGKSIGVDVSGSVNTIKKAGEDIIKKYGIKPQDLELAYHDMGSYSAKPKAHGDKLDYSQWLDYNQYNRGFSGAPLIIPKKAYGGDPSLPNIEGHYPFGGIHTKTHTHMKEGGWLDEYQPGGRVMPSETTQSQVPAYMKSLPKSLKEAQKKETNKKEREDKIIDEIKKTGKIPKNAPENIKLYYTVEPTSYTDYKNIKRLISDESRNVQKSTMYPADEDAWKKYLGLLNESENIKRSKEKPSKAKSEYNQYYKLNDDLEKQYFKDIMQKLEKSKDTNIVTNEFDIQKQTKDTNPYSVLGNFTIGKGKDPLTNKTYVSYYDKYDFNSAPWFMKDKLESVGKPFEFYNRFYPPEYINEIGDTLRFGENDTYMEYFLDDYYNSKLPNKRRGGLYTPSKIKRKAKKYGTSKNIQSSINKLFTRNYDVFGPGGKNIYNPNVYKTGGWLDNVD